jgi:hypothetical protein
MPPRRLLQSVRCTIHDKDFVRFTGARATHSYGCPDCVAKHREHVRKVRATPYGAKSRGRPKAQGVG